MIGKIDEARDWLPIVRAEYAEFPGMQLTRPQIRRLWNLDADTCDAIVEALEAERFLRKTLSDAYVRADWSSQSLGDATHPADAACVAVTISDHT